jgi:hypothetical protein
MKPTTPPKPRTYEEALEQDRAAGFEIIPSTIAAGVVFAFLVKPSGKTILKGYRGTRAARARFEFSYRTLREAKLFAKDFAEGQVENAIWEAARRAKVRA